MTNRGTGGVRVTLDLHGHTLSHAATTTGGLYTPISLVRPADRTTIPAWGNLQLETSGISGLPATGVRAVALTVILKSPSTGTMRVYAAGDVFPAEANADYAPNTTTQFFTIVKPGPDGRINLHNLGYDGVEISVDVIGYYTSAHRGSTLTAIRPAPVAGGVTIAAGGTRVLRLAGVAGIPASGISAAGLTIAAKGTASGAVSIVPQSGPATARVVAYALGKDTTGFTTAALRPDGTVVLKNEGSAPVTVSVDAHAYFTTR